MSNYSHKNEKSIYKCSHCHDISIILERCHGNSPVCPLCKGLLKTEQEENSLNQTISPILVC